MQNLDAIAEQIEKEMDEKDAVRELALKSSRAVIRLAGSAIRSLHRKENVDTVMTELRDELSKMQSILEGHPDLTNAGFVENALGEYSEANIVLAVLRKRQIPSPRDLCVSNGAYLQGMGDAVGEFRRIALDCLREGRVNDALSYLNIMEAIHNMLMRFDYPDALLSVRRLQDVTRSLVEKTSGEIAISARTKDLEEKLDEVRKIITKHGSKVSANSGLQKGAKTKK